MKAFKLVLAGIAILMCAIWVATKINTEIRAMNKNVIIKKDSTWQDKEEVRILIPPFCIPTSMSY